MDATRRIHQRTLPNVSGQTLSGVMGLLAAIGFGTAALPSLLSGALLEPSAISAASRPRPFHRERTAAEPAAALPAPEVAASRISTHSPSNLSPSSASHTNVSHTKVSHTKVLGIENAVPRVERVGFEHETLTASSDLRLRIHASDPDGDPFRIRTTWFVDGREVETDRPVLARSHFSRGSHVRASVVAIDHQGESRALATDEVVVSNAPPRITTFPTGFDATGSFAYALGATDPDGDRNLAFDLVSGPAGMRLDAHESIVTWRPSPRQTGTHLVHLEVRDGHGGLQSQAFELRAPAPQADVALAEHTRSP
jgi:hypothetical protein